jgi:hypothetical protein
MGLTTASVGMCGVVYSQINDLLFGSDNYTKDAPVTNDSTYNFLIFLACSMFAGIFFGSFFLGPFPPVDTPYQQIVSTTNDEEEEDHQPLVQQQEHNQDIESSPLLEAIDANKVEQDHTEVSISGIQFITHPIGFALFCTLFVVLGVGYVYLANIGQILNAVSIESSQHSRNLHITLFSLGNCGSRAFFGALSDILRNKFGIHRMWIFVFAVISMLITLTYIVSAAVTPETLIPCTLVISVAYGIVFGVAPATTTEFGTEVKKNSTILFLTFTKFISMQNLGICTQLGLAFICTSFW